MGAWNPTQHLPAAMLLSRGARVHNQLTWHWDRFKRRLRCFLWTILCGTYWAPARVYWLDYSNVTKEQWMKGMRRYRGFEGDDTTPDEAV